MEGKEREMRGCSEGVEKVLEGILWVHGLVSEYDSGSECDKVLCVTGSSTVPDPHQNEESTHPLARK